VRHTALLVVHGIGAQRPGVTVRKLAEGLTRMTGEAPPQENDGVVTASVGGRTVRLYEVYWADVLMGGVTRGTFRMNEVQSLSWFPWLNVRGGLYPPGSYSWLRLAWWCTVLPIANFFVLFAHAGASLVAQIVTAPFDKDAVTRTNARGKPWTVVDQVLDEYAGDVVNYINSAGAAFYREPDEPMPPDEVVRAHVTIMERFAARLLEAAGADGCESIQVVAHSLGTVIAYHALSGFRGAAAAEAVVDARMQSRLDAARRKVTRLYTLGCPLEKFRFFWPAMAAAPAGSPSTPLAWANYVSYLDPIAGRLRNFNVWGTVSNHHLLGGGFIRGHVVYEHSRVFIGALAEGLCGRRVTIVQDARARLRDSLVLFAETLVAPIGVMAILTIGAMLFAAVAMMIPWGLSWVVRWFVPEATWRPVVDTASLVMLGMMALAFLVAPAVRARRAHRQYWGRSR
jgi:hypothetical protein